MKACSSVFLPNAESLLDSRARIAQNILWQDADRCHSERSEESRSGKK